MSPVATTATKYDPSQFNKEHNEVTAKGAYTISRKNSAQSRFPDFLPTWDPSQKMSPLKFFTHNDRGVNGHPEYANLLACGPESRLKPITPKFGTEIRGGLQLSTLSNAAKDDLALLVATRGVVVLRDQDFATYGPQFMADFGRYFGPLHVHPTSGSPEGVPELHVTFRGASKVELESAFQTRTNSISWHSDVSYELNPPHYTIFTVLEGPEAGGDTIFANCVEAYKRLSPTMQKMILGLHVLHTAEDQAHVNQAAGGVIRRAPVSSIHPLVRQHPVTGEKFLYLNREFGRRIVELKQEESDNLLEFLFSHVEQAHDLQLRASWEPNTVVLWDNRSTVHSAVIDWDTPVLRHAVRVSPQGERPVENLEQLNEEEYLEDKEYLKELKDGRK